MCAAELCFGRSLDRFGSFPSIIIWINHKYVVYSQQKPITNKPHRRVFNCSTHFKHLL